MSNYIVSDSNLTSVANAIRTKGGTSAQLAFPAGFVSAIEAIQTGGGGVPGVTVLRGHGTTPVDLPSGFTFPDKNDCLPTDPTDPFVGVYLLYFDVDYDDFDNGTGHTRVIGAKYASEAVFYDAFSANNATFTSSDMNNSVTFSISNGTIVPASAILSMVYTGIINANTEWLMIVVDERT